MHIRSMGLRGVTARTILMFVAASTLALAACGTSSTTGGSGATCPSTNTLTGAGSTFDNPLFSKMFDSYVNVTCGAQVTYSSVGSGAGITQLLAQTVDFGATDTPLTDAQLAQSANGLIIHIPVTLGAVAITYNLSQVSAATHLKFTGAVIADIFLGKVKYWDDSEIAQLNSGTTLPHVAVTVVHRSDGSGTTGIFSHYLSAVSPAWQSTVGAGTTLNWPAGVGAKGNAGVAAQVKNTAGSIGYNELAYVLTNTIQYGAVQNANSEWVLPSLDSAKAAAANVTTIPADLRFFIVNAPGAGSYPISGFSWVIVYQKQKDADKGQAIANMLWWMTHDGQQYSTALSYVPLPATMVTKDEAQIKSMTCGSSGCYKP
ncbi:MAG: phosphate ABC transporter substrate-binding protein PstS [Ktedonobacterales bacterium]